MYDVRKNLGILDTPLPLVRISRNLSVLFVRKIRQFLNPTSPLERDVIHRCFLIQVTINQTVISVELFLLYNPPLHSFPPFKAFCRNIFIKPEIPCHKFVCKITIQSINSTCNLLDSYLCCNFFLHLILQSILLCYSRPLAVTFSFRHEFLHRMFLSKIPIQYIARLYNLKALKFNQLN